MHLKLRKFGITVDREWVKMWQSRRLKRRFYVAVGPYCLWHINGSDKHKLSGFAVHGAIDGYSRRLLQLRVASTNNDLKVIGSYYLDTVENLALIPLFQLACKDVLCRQRNDESFGNKSFHFLSRQNVISILLSCIKLSNFSSARCSTWSSCEGS